VSWDDRSGRIARSGPRTVWQQIADDLAADIGSGALPHESRLPSEDELASIYGVARLTVRRAVRHLAETGFVAVVQGRGTYVISEKRERDE
jgi:GntR family transcriptional regulator